MDLAERAHGIRLVVVGFFGRIQVHSKLRGIRRTASLSERLYLSRITTLMKANGIFIGPGSRPLIALMREFANYVLLRGGDAWTLFFRVWSPERWAEHFSHY